MLKTKQWTCTEGSAVRSRWRYPEQSRSQKRQYDAGHDQYVDVEADLATDLQRVVEFWPGHHPVVILHYRSAGLRCHDVPLGARLVAWQVEMWTIGVEVEIQLGQIVCPRREFELTCLDVKRKHGHIDLAGARVGDRKQPTGKAVVCDWHDGSFGRNGLRVGTVTVQSRVGGLRYFFLIYMGSYAWTLSCVRCAPKNRTCFHSKTDL